MTPENIGRGTPPEDFSSSEEKLKTLIRNAVQFGGFAVDEAKLKNLDLSTYKKQAGGVLQSLPEIIEVVQKKISAIEKNDAETSGGIY